MKRRGFIKAVRGLAGVVAVPAPANQQHGRSRTAHGILLQEVELARFQYYEGERVFPQLGQGDRLTLKRAPLNPYDKRAVEVYWGNSILGHIPRVGNMAISQMMDRGEAISAKITALNQSENPWRRIKLAIYLEEPGLKSS